MKRILLCCNAGMSTSLLVQKMNKEVESRGLDISIKALPMGQAMEHLDEADVVLLGPQIGYAKGDFEKATSVPVAVIPMADYGRMNAKKVIDDALKLLG
jgi:PTS system cellobiose-specific IIB component